MQDLLCYTCEIYQDDITVYERTKDDFASDSFKVKVSLIEMEYAGHVLYQYCTRLQNEATKKVFVGSYKAATIIYLAYRILS